MDRPPDAARLLERDRELQAIAGAIADARAGRGRLVLVEGAGGLGKSRLVAEALAGPDGITVVRSCGVELERDFPFGVAVRMLHDQLHAGSGEERRALLSGAAGLAAQLFAGRTFEAAERSSEFSLLHGLHWLVANLSEREPLVLAVDDAHWADSLSLRFLCYLAQRLADLPVLVLVAHRPAEPGAANDLLIQLAASPGAERLELAPLGEEAVSALIRARYDGAMPVGQFTGACHQATGGNPLLLRELLAALEEEGVAPDAAGAARAREIGPCSVWRAVELQLARLGGDATAIARAAAVLDRDAGLVDVAALAGVDTRAASTAAVALARAGVILPGEPLGFVHPIIRQAVLEELTPIERAAAHRDAATLLRGRADVERIAGHLLAGRVDREDWAVAVLRSAAERALAHGAPASAARLFERAREEAVDPRLRADLALALGRSAAQAGLPSAVAVLEEARDASIDPVQRADVMLELGRAQMGRGAFAAAADAFSGGAQALAGSGDDHTNLVLELESGYVASALWSPDGGVAVMDRVASLIESGREPRVPGERALLASLGGGEMLRNGDRARAVELAWRAWGDGRYLDELGPDDPSLSAITGTLALADAFDRAEEVAAATIVRAREIGSLTAFASFSYVRGTIRHLRGDLADAISDLEAAREAEASGWEQYVTAARWQLVLVALARGDEERARSAARLLPEQETALRSRSTFAGLLVGRGALALHDGDAPAALALFEESGQMQEAMGLRNESMFGWRTYAAEACMRLGDVERAQELARAALELSEAWGAPRALACALRTVGLTERDPPARRALLERAVGVVSGSGADLEEARSQLAFGAALRREGKRSIAQQPLRAALDLADRCGALPLAARAREELVAVGVRPRRARLTGPGALTPSERRVARLAAEGLTNREIAEALFVTRKAIEYHLGNVYRKLGTRTRDDLGVLLGPECEPGEA